MLLGELFFYFSLLTRGKMVLLSRKLARQHFMERSKFIF